MNIENNESKIVQFSFEPKLDLFLRHGDAFYWTVPILANQLIDLFIGFLSYTNDSLMDRRQSNQNISLLNDSVLNALDIDKVSEGEILNN